MKYPPTYPAPTIVTQQAGRYYADEGSSSFSAGAHDRRHKIHHENWHAPMSTMPTTIQQQQQFLQNNLSPILTSEQPGGRRSRSRTRRRHRRSSEPHRHHYDSRSRSRDESPTRLPRGYRPTSPDRYSSDGSRSREFSHSFSPTQNIPMGSRPPSDPRTQSSTLAGNLHSTIPSQYTILPKHSHHSNRHRSSSHSHPDGYSSSRPQYFHRRSRSYDDVPSGYPRKAHPLPQQSNGGYSPESTHQPYQTQTAAYPTSGHPATGMGYGVGAVQPSSASPIIMHPQAHQTTVVPLNDGKDGWVVVPAQGQNLSVVSSFVLSSFQSRQRLTSLRLYSNTDPLVPTTH
jgi:hypothetical protein